MCGKLRMMARPNDLQHAIEKCGTTKLGAGARRYYRVTAPDVAAAGGYEIEAARAALMLFANAVNGAIEVSSSGELVFVFSEDCWQILRSSRSSTANFLAQSGKTLTKLAKAVFGLFLLASFALVRPLLQAAVLLPAGKNRASLEDTTEFSGFSLRSELSCLQASLVSDGNDPVGSSSVADDSLILACFSFLFGGHNNPTAGLEDEEMAAIARVIRENRGAIIVEQVAPFLIDTAATEAVDVAGDSISVDSCMLPILSRFEGLPHVIPEGQLVYLFPHLLATTAPAAQQPPASVRWIGNLWNSTWKRVTGPASKDYLEEKRIPFMPPAHRRHLQRVLMVVGLNWLGCLVLGAALGPLQVSLRLTNSAGTLLAINVAYGLILANSLGYILVPAVRGILLGLANIAIEERNQRRRQHAQKLLTPFGEVKRKLAAARARQYESEPIQDGDVYYTSAKSLSEQNAHNPQLEAWDRALARGQQRDAQ